MSVDVYRILDRKREGEALEPHEIEAVAAGAADGSWGDAELGAFLMGAAIRGLDARETSTLVRAMRDSGDCWRLAERVPGVVDKHSTGGVGDKVSLILGPLLAACGVPVAMLTGRALGHTGGTADKLESIPGIELGLDLARCVDLVERVGLAIGIATSAIAPADQRLYALRDRTGTVRSIPLVVASILSKKLATGCAGIAFDVKVGDGAFFPETDDATRLASLLVETSTALGCPASALLTDMSQPLGRWVGHAAEVNEALETLSGEGEERLREVTLALAAEAASLSGASVGRARLERALGDGSAREAFLAWARAQGARPEWVERPSLPLAPLVEDVLAPRSGRLAAIETRELGLSMQRACRRSDGSLDPGVALRVERAIGDLVTAGEPVARLYLREVAEGRATVIGSLFRVVDGDGGDSVELPTPIHARIDAESLRVGS